MNCQEMIFTDIFLFYFLGDAGCKGNSRGGITYPGISNLKALQFNDLVSSYHCY